MSIIPLQWRLHNPFRGQLTLGFYSLIPADLSTAWFLLCQTSSGSRNCSQWPPSGTSVLMPGSQNWKAKLLLAYAQGAGSVHQGLPWPCLGHEGWFVQGWPLIIHSRGTDPHQQGVLGPGADGADGGSVAVLKQELPCYLLKKLIAAACSNELWNESVPWAQRVQ